MKRMFTSKYLYLALTFSLIWQLLPHLNSMLPLEKRVKAQDPIANYFGCQNNNTAKCLDFGAPNQSYSWIPADYQNNLDIAQTEGDTNYRALKSQKELLIEIPVFNANQEGFPNSDLMLEIRYKDTIDGVTSTKDANNRPLIQSKINFGSKTWEILDSLESINNEHWKITQIPIPKTKWQRLRAIDGKYTINIKMPVNKPESTLPLDYLSLSSISSQDYQSYLQWQRDRRDLKRIDFTETNPAPNLSDDLTWFTRPLEQQVFPNTIPKASEIEKPISIVSARDEYEPLVFSIYAKKSFSNINFNISDFLDSKNNRIISKDNIEVNKVVYNEKYWLSYSTEQTYGLMPDYLEKISSLNINQNTSQQLWFILKIPDNCLGGTYYGNIKILNSNDELKTIPVSVNVLPILLKTPKSDNILYHMPYTKIYSTDNEKVFQDFRSHETNGIFSFGSANFIFAYNSTSGELTYDTTKFTQQLGEAITKGVISRRAYFLNMDAVGRQIAKAIHGESNWTSDLYFEVVETSEFKTAFRQFIKELRSIGLERKVELVFQVVDEPGGDWERRLSSDRLYRLIKAEGGKTWVTYYDTCDQKLECPQGECQDCTDCIRENGKIYIPPLSNLVDYKVYAMRYVKESNKQADPDSYAYYTTYYSQVRNPVYNRFLHGLMAAKTDAKVIANYAYGDYVGDPYNDFDAPYNFNFPYSFPDFLMSYPTWDGEMLPTVAFEGAREGIKDAKYFSTLEELIKSSPDDPVSQEAKNYLNNILGKISENWEMDYADKKNDYGFANKILANVSETSSETDYAAFDRIRNKVAFYIDQLYNKMFTITINKKYTYTGDTLIYSVLFTNKTGEPISNMVITNPIENSVQYIVGSATNNGVFENGTISWKIPSLPINGTFSAQFKVEVKP